MAGSPYAITQGTLAANSNYTIHLTASTLSITPATATLSVHAPGGVYTGSPIAPQATVTGVSGTAAASLEGVTPTLTYYVGSGTSGKELGAGAHRRRDLHGGRQFPRQRQIMPRSDRLPRASRSASRLPRSCWYRTRS